MEPQRLQGSGDAHQPVSNGQLDARAQAAALHATPACLLNVINAVAVLNGRWAPAILATLYVVGEPTRFGALHRRIPDISQKELARHLGHLVAQRVLRRQEEGGAVRYSLTEDGLKLLGRMKSLGEWSRERHAANGPGAAGEAARPASWVDPILR